MRCRRVILKPNWQPASDLVPVPGDTTGGSVPRTRGESSGSPDSSQSTPPPPNALAPDAYQPPPRPCYNVPAPHALKKTARRKKTGGRPHLRPVGALHREPPFDCKRTFSLREILHITASFIRLHPPSPPSLTSRASSRLSKMPAKSPVSAGQRRRSLR